MFSKHTGSRFLVGLCISLLVPSERICLKSMDSCSTPRLSFGSLSTARTEPEDAGTPGRSSGSFQEGHVEEESFALSESMKPVHGL